MRSYEVGKNHVFIQILSPTGDSHFPLELIDDHLPWVKDGGSQVGQIRLIELKCIRHAYIPDPQDPHQARMIHEFMFVDSRGSIWIALSPTEDEVSPDLSSQVRDELLKYPFGSIAMHRLHYYSFEALYSRLSDCIYNDKMNHHQYVTDRSTLLMDRLTPYFQKSGKNATANWVFDSMTID